MQDKAAPAAKVVTFVCPNCDFEGKSQVDIEAHLASLHGEEFQFFGPAGDDGKGSYYTTNSELHLNEAQKHFDNG